MSQPRSLVDLLEERSSTRAEQRLYTFLDDEGADEGALSYAELFTRARRIGAALQELAPPGERAVLLYPPGIDYVSGFFGTLFSGLVAVPAYPPDPSRLERTLPRLRAIIQDARATVVLTTSFVLSMVEELFQDAPDLKALRWVATDTLSPGRESLWRKIGRGTSAWSWPWPSCWRRARCSATCARCEASTATGAMPWWGHSSGS